MASLKKRDAYNEEGPKHPGYSVEIARPYLEQEGYDDAFITQVCDLVLYHDDREREGDINLKILQDADLLADAGFPGFLRPFLFAGQRKRSLEETRDYLNETQNRVDQVQLEHAKKIAQRLLEEEKELKERFTNTFG